MIGAIIGDIIGSTYEFTPIKTTDFELYTQRSHFTDDSVLTVATADVIMNGGDYAEVYSSYGRRWPAAGYGARFASWVNNDSHEPYNSFGNGSAMRVSPIAFAYNNLDQILQEAKRSAECTHNHPEGIKGAQATAAAIYLARKKKDKAFLRTYLQDLFGYDLSRKVDDIRPHYRFDVTCQGSVPESIICFLEANSFEETLRLCVSLGGDADTMCAIAGPIAQAYFDDIAPSHIVKMAEILDPELFSKTFKFLKWCEENKEN